MLHLDEKNPVFEILGLFPSQAFLGQKYGYRPFPPNIKAAEFEYIYNALQQKGVDVKDLNLWYKKDENIVPPMYNLQPITSQLPHYNSKVRTLST